MWAIQVCEASKSMVFAAAVLVINRVLILAILVIINNRVWVLYSSLELFPFLGEASFSSLSIRPSTKALHKLCLWLFYIGLIYLGNIF